MFYSLPSLFSDSVSDSMYQSLRNYGPVWTYFPTSDLKYSIWNLDKYISFIPDRNITKILWSLLKIFLFWNKLLIIYFSFIKDNTWFSFLAIYNTNEIIKSYQNVFTDIFVCIFLTCQSVALKMLGHFSTSVAYIYNTDKWEIKINWLNTEGIFFIFFL